MKRIETGVEVERLGKAGPRNAERLWQAPDGQAAVLALRPLAAAFGAIVRARRAAYQNGWLQAERAAVPVISVGNLTVGGSGKTPFTRWLTGRLLERGQQPAILHGGYGDDEPALHRSWHNGVKVYAARDRAESARRAAAEGASVLLLDDGLQHLRLARDLDIILVAADNWNQPHRLLPAGAWREPLATLRAAGAVVVTRKAAPRAQADVVARALRGQIGNAVLAIAALELTECYPIGGAETEAPADEVVVLCAIANPLALVDQLEATGVRVTLALAFDDHHEYTPEELRQVKQKAGSRPIITTEKDAVKIARIDPGFRALVVQQRVVIESGEADLSAAVQRVLQ